MSKNSGMGRKRIDNRDSKGLGKCTLGGHAEQCGNAKKITKGKYEWDSMKNEWEINKHTSNPFEADMNTSVTYHKGVENLKYLQKQASQLEKDLKKVKEKIEKLNGN